MVPESIFGGPAFGSVDLDEDGEDEKLLPDLRNVSLVGMRLTVVEWSWTHRGLGR